MTGPKRLCYVNCGLPADECACYRDIMSRAGDPAVLAALPEVQALIAAAAERVERAAQIVARHKRYWEEVADEIRNLTPADATAALARIEREAEARGRAMGLREAAGIAEGAWGEGPTGHYDNGGTMDGWNLACSHVASAILARAAEIEREIGNG